MNDSGVPIKHSLIKHTMFYNLMDDIINKIKNEIKSIEKLKLDPELTLLVCNLIENTIPTGNKYKIDKKDLSLQILTNIFALHDGEKEIINQQIEFLYNNNKIKKVPILTNVKNFALTLLQKKLL